MNPYSGQNQGQSTSPLAGIIGTVLQLAPYAIPELGVPAKLLAGAAGTAAANAVEDKPQNLGEDAMGGVQTALLGGLGKAKSAREANAVEGEIVDDTAKNDTGLTLAPKVTENPTSINPETGGGHVNFDQNEIGQVTPTPNTYTPPKPQTAQAPPTTPVTNTAVATTPPEKPTPVSQTSDTDTFTQVNPQAVQNNLNPGQKMGQDIAIPALEQQIRQAGGRATSQEVQQLARQLHENGYSSLNDAASDGGLITGDQGIINNGVRNHIDNADKNGAVVDLGDYNNLIQNHINDALSSGVLTPAQEKILQKSPNTLKNLIGGNAGDRDLVGELTLEQAQNTPVMNAFNTVQAFQKAGARQGLIAQGRGISSEGASTLKNFYNNLANDIQDRAFNVANGGSPLSDENIDNMIGQIKAAPFKNKDVQTDIIKQLESGKGGNLTVQAARSMQAPAVKAMIAASPNQVSNLANGLMTAGLSKAGAINAVLNSNPGLVAKAKAGNTLYKLSSPDGGVLSGVLGGGISGGNMRPLGKIALGAGVLGAGGLGLNALATASQAQQAQQQLNNPLNQQTNDILNNANAQQRYLGAMGEIRSIFAPTFDTNAGQAGQVGASLLQRANQNAQAQQAAQTLLQARASMGQGGILGGILSMIPGTQENAYKQAAANAQAQLNSLGVAGTAPGVMSSGSVMPSLTSAAGSVGAF